MNDSLPALRVIVGLGNPGAQYQRTRHNAGFHFLDALAARLDARFVSDGKLGGEAAKVSLAGQALWLFRPMKFMNRSGGPLQAFLAYYRVDPAQCLIAHDDLDLAPGVARLKFDGGHGGQNGLRDIIAQLGHARFHRLRVGIGHPGHRDQVLSWVLGRASQDDDIAIHRAIDDAVSVMDLAVAGNFNEAMKRLHTSARN